MDTLLTRLKTRATALKADTYALYLAARDPRTPLLAKVLAMGVAAYALSPIDLIPDFIPVLGYLDDLLIVPIGLAAAIRLVPKDVMEECRAKALEGGIEKSRTAAVVIVLVWIAAIALVAYPVVRGIIGR
jgi:uncharacterized membrane protein YkvA (DUF1232 family)